MPTQLKSGAKEARALAVYQRLLRASDLLERAARNALPDVDVTVSQLALLETLHRAGPMNQRAIGRELGRSHSNVTLVLDNLERRGWVVRRRHSDDRRFVTIHATAAGRAIIDSALPGQTAAVTAALTHLSVAEQEELGRICQKLGVALGADREPAGDS